MVLYHAILVYWSIWTLPIGFNCTTETYNPKPFRQWQWKS